jgi:hypothetical protein
LLLVFFSVILKFDINKTKNSKGKENNFKTTIEVMVALLNFLFHFSSSCAIFNFFFILFYKLYILKSIFKNKKQKKTNLTTKSKKIYFISCTYI